MSLLLKQKENKSFFLFFRIIRFGHNKEVFCYFVLAQLGLNNGIIKVLF